MVFFEVTLGGSGVLCFAFTRPLLLLQLTPVGTGVFCLKSRLEVLAFSSFLHHSGHDFTNSITGAPKRDFKKKHQGPEA